MQKFVLSACFFCLAFTCQVRAQSINNKSWKTYIGAPINDTAILNIYHDSSSITNTHGQVMVRHQCQIAGDTMTIMDFGPEEQGCAGIKGSYRINLSGDSFTLAVINDPCEGRSQALARKWVEAKK